MPLPQRGSGRWHGSPGTSFKEQSSVSARPEQWYVYVSVFLKKNPRGRRRTLARNIGNAVYYALTMSVRHYSDNCHTEREAPCYVAFNMVEKTQRLGQNKRPDRHYVSRSFVCLSLSFAPVSGFFSNMVTLHRQVCAITLIFYITLPLILELCFASSCYILTFTSRVYMSWARISNVTHVIVHILLLRFMCRAVFVERSCHRQHLHKTTHVDPFRKDLAIDIISRIVEIALWCF